MERVCLKVENLTNLKVPSDYRRITIIGNLDIFFIIFILYFFI